MTDNFLNQNDINTIFISKEAEFVNSIFLLSGIKIVIAAVMNKTVQCGFPGFGNVIE